LIETGLYFEEISFGLDVGPIMIWKICHLIVAQPSPSEAGPIGRQRLSWQLGSRLPRLVCLLKRRSRPDIDQCWDWLRAHQKG